MSRYPRRVPTQSPLRVSTAFYSLLVLAALGGGYLLFGPQPPSPGSSSKRGEPTQLQSGLSQPYADGSAYAAARCQQQLKRPGTNGLGPEERERFYHLTEGSEYLYLPV